MFKKVPSRKLEGFVDRVVNQIAPSGQLGKDFSRYYVHVLVTKPESRKGLFPGESARVHFGLYKSRFENGRGTIAGGPYASHEETVYVDDGKLDQKEARDTEMFVCQELLNLALLPYNLETIGRDVNGRIALSQLVEDKHLDRPVSRDRATELFARMRELVVATSLVKA